ncbi:madf domain transcription factor [Holotrichia oblita]|uniref:Madf domain transcription factor n=1 Tax=Holotrichia oblita TaxID=644536 RepID=A0ACB9STW4_HOLOL|nr:madf domain transcription factor [Holotrichia oblita]
MLSQNKGKRLRFSVEEDEKLINTVQKHPALYDASNKLYKNQNVRDNAWDDVAGVVGRCVLECKTRWKSLKDVYFKKKKENKQGTGSQAIHVSKWEHMDALSFLENVQTSRKHITNCSIEIIETEDLGESPTCSPSQPDIVEEVVQDTPTEDSVRRNTATNKKRKISNENIVEILNKRAEERTKLLKTIGEASVKPRNHPIKTFFESMAETVMTFPTFLAVQAKQEVLRVISELELQACETTLNNRNFSSTSTYTTPTVSRTPVDDSATNSTYAELSSVEPRTYEDCADLLIDQAIKLAHPDFRKENLSKVKTILEKNSYPKEFYNKLITKRINKTCNTGTKSNNNIYHTIPYINNLSDTIKHELKKSDIHITFIPTNRHLFTNLKTPIKHGNQSNVVYKLDCKDCNKCYIGQTKQYLKKRIYNHQYAVTHNVTAETALSKHSKDRRHNFDFQNTKILKKGNNYKKRLIYEMIYIKKAENAVNFRTDIDHLSVIYNNLIHA